MVVSNTYRVVFWICLSSSCCFLCCEFLWIVQLLLSLQCSLTFIYLDWLWSQDLLTPLGHLVSIWVFVRLYVIRAFLLSLFFLPLYLFGCMHFSGINTDRIYHRKLCLFSIMSAFIKRFVGESKVNRCISNADSDGIRVSRFL